ncbi:MAG: hypothetical protein Q8L57_01525 [bacterium]|nr:hypothetical protein [bacterium]
MDENPHSALTESELLIKKLREHPILAKLTDYALGCGINLLVHPCFEEMVGKDYSAWIFFDFSIQGGGCFIFIPFDRQNIIANSIDRQIFCLAHELGHFQLKDSLAHRQIAGQCRTWRDRFAKNGQDVCLLKELFADLEATRILKEICQVAMRNHGWRVTLLNLWLQCSDCLRVISRGDCSRNRAVAKAMNGLAKIANLYKREINRQMAEIKNQP